MDGAEPGFSPLSSSPVKPQLRDVCRNAVVERDRAERDESGDVTDDDVVVPAAPDFKIFDEGDDNEEC